MERRRLMRGALCLALIGIGGTIWLLARTLHREQLNSALIDAVVDSNSEQVQRMLREGASVNSRQEDVYEIADLIRQLRGEALYIPNKRPSALMIACSKGDVAMVKLLLEAGADVNVQRLYDVDALFDAVQNVGGNGSTIIHLPASHGAKFDLNTKCGQKIWSQVEYKPEIRHILQQLWPDQKAGHEDGKSR